MPAYLIATAGPLSGLVLTLEKKEDWIIGRDPDVADLVVEDSTVSRKHARIIKTAQGFFFQNLSRVNPALINGEQRDDRVLLQEGDAIQIGHQQFLFSEKSPSEPKKGKKSSPKKSREYDNIFGELEEPPPPSREEPDEELARAEELARSPEAPAEPEPTAYDTIFEDAEEQAEIPFHLLPPAPLLLKVISGPNAGAEIGIEKGKSYVLGKDSNSCDIVFQDLSVSRNHAKLTVSPEGVIELEDLGSKNGTSVNGKLLSEKTVITSQDLISLGTTIFLIIDREAPQETIYSPSVPATFEPVAKEAEPSPLESEMAAKETDWKQLPLPPKHLILAASFAAIFLIVFLSFFSLFKSQSLEVVHKEPAGHIKEALEKFNAVEFSYNPGSGKLFITGHVLNGVEYQEMMYRVEQMPFIQTTENTVVIDELVWKMTNDILSDTPEFRAVSVHSPKAGSFIAAGYVPKSADLALLNEYLTVNFPYLDRLDNRVASVEVLTAEVQSTLIANEFGGVTFQLTGGDLVLSGGYDKNRQSQYEATVKTLNQFAGIARVRDLAIPQEASAAGINITDNYKVGGAARSDGHGYSVVLNGKIYMIGDTVDGMSIQSIGEKTIFLAKDGLNYRIDYTNGRP